MRVIVVHNSRAGYRVGSAFRRREPQVDLLRSTFAALGVDADVRDAARIGVTEAARQAAQASVDAVVAAGGDGTVSAVASALLHRESRAALGVLPAGTLNHFARDMGIPSALPEAARVIAQGHVRRVDVAQVNGHYFLNNSSIGLYPQIVWHRDRQRERLGRGKWIAMAVAALSVFRRYPMLHVTLDADVVPGHNVSPAGPLRCATPFVFIGNNRYEMDLFSMGTRQAIDRAELSLYVTRCGGRLALLRLALRGLFGRLEQARDFDAMAATRCRIETRKRRLRIALDGEVVRMHPPLEYRILPARLPVLAPAAGVTGAARL